MPTPNPRYVAPKPNDGRPLREGVKLSRGSFCSPPRDATWPPPELLGSLGADPTLDD